MIGHDQLETTAATYLATGLCVLPAIRAEKRPAVGRWKQYQQRKPTESELTAWLANGQDALCILCGQVSGNLETIDFDGGGALYQAWCERIPAELRSRLVIERTPAGGYHGSYRSEQPVCGNLKLAQRKDGDKVITLIETRGEGGLFLCSPTPGYELIQGDLDKLPVLSENERNDLLLAAWELNEFWPPVVDGPKPSGKYDPAIDPVTVTNATATRPGDDFNQRGDVRDLLRHHGWTLSKPGENEYWCRPGKTAGTSATLKDRVFYVFSSNAEPFKSDRGYSPFAVYTELEHQGDYEQAARALRMLGYGSESYPSAAPGVDISGILEGNSEKEVKTLVPDPGAIPEHLFRVPGFISEVVDFTLANAPYPNLGLAFCGALALQSFLAGRRVASPGDLRPNIYLLALASSGTGKDFPRKVNARVLYEIGMLECLGDKFASGEGIQDALLRKPAMLFQNDEMDGVLRQINLDRENKRDSIPAVMMTLHSSAASVYATRVRAGQKEMAHIDQPHLTLFGTATPQFFYESLSQRMLTNGFFSRLIIIDIGKRGQGQMPGSIRALPARILETAHWWANFKPGKTQGNLWDMHPEQKIVPFSPPAEAASREFQQYADQEFNRANERNDEVVRVAWSRTNENAQKFALLYACSKDHQNPVIDEAAIAWASEIAMHQTRRQLFLAQSYVAENPFHAECLKFLRKLTESPGQQMARNQLMRFMHCKLQDFEQIIQTLMQQGDIQPVEITSKTKTALGYRLA